MNNSLSDDIAAMKPVLETLPTDWEGKASILEMQAADDNWRQMEWWGFYFELLCRRALNGICTIPGDRFGSIVFDMKRTVNWDLKASAIKSDSHRAILNDKTAMELSIQQYGEHGAIIALCDVEYNDTDRTFQRWHTELKGGLSKYENERIVRTSISRYRKTRATLAEMLFVRFDGTNSMHLGTMRQGRNSNGAPRPEKYMLNLESLEPFYVDRIVFR
ncbi:MAG: hypothetical protein M3Y58_07905 [Chloroflexota bacterium]|nr:hypothetical protein [Chloroflexota bacterium]